MPEKVEKLPRKPAEPSKITVTQIRDMKGSARKITSVTAYDYPTGKLVDDAGIDIVLVGDSLSNTVLGYENTLPVTLREMLHHTKAVRRAVKHALLVGDMPFGCYQGSIRDAINASVRFVKEGGVDAVKLEGGAKRTHLIRQLVDNEIPVMGHIGLTPQSVLRMGGYKVQGKNSEDANRLIEDAIAIEKAGVFSMVLEGVPAEIARIITERSRVPTIGIGAGAHCDGQVLVFTDLVGLSFGHVPKFVRPYADLRSTISTALAQFATDVSSGNFPNDDESYHVSDDVASKIKKAQLGFTA